MPLANQDALSQPERLKALHDLALLDPTTNEAFDRLTNLASRILKAPVSLISLVDIDRQVFKSHIGLPEPWATTRETPLSHSFCQHVVATSTPLVIEDAREHPLVHDNLAIEDLNVIAYAGLPLTTSDNLTLGSFCVIDSNPRVWNEEELGILRDLAASAMSEIELLSEIRNRKHTEELLRQRQEFIENVTRTLPDVIYIYEPANDRVVYVNHLAPTSLGYTDTEAERLNASFVRRVMHPDDYAQLSALYHNPPSDPNAIVETEYRMKTINNEWTWFLNRERVYNWREGKPHYILGIAHDITEEKRAASLKEDLTAERQRVQVLSNFIRDTSHDFRTPISLISTGLEILPRIKDEAKRLEKIDTMKSYVDYLVKMLSQLQRMVMLDSTEKLDLQPAEINKLIEYACLTLEGKIESKGLTLKKEFDSKLPTVAVHTDSFEELMIHLISNAILFTAEGGTIMVSSKQRDEQVVVEISDTGVGIKAEHLPHIFERFFKVDESRKLGTGGAGMGLSIVKRIVELHHGTIEVDSVVGEGSTFRVVLPVRNGG